eukprot:3440786-Lingulodinium_polyedra.AAC.1
MQRPLRNCCHSKIAAVLEVAFHALSLRLSLAALGRGLRTATIPATPLPANAIDYALGVGWRLGALQEWSTSPQCGPWRNRRSPAARNVTGSPRK